MQTRCRTTAQTPAADFEVSTRTIYRDNDHMSAANPPVYADLGPNRVFELLDASRTRFAGLSPDEAVTFRDECPLCRDHCLIVTGVFAQLGRGQHLGYCKRDGDKRSEQTGPTEEYDPRGIKPLSAAGVANVL
jgi:hypothetical protein